MLEKKLPIEVTRSFTKDLCPAAEPRLIHSMEDEGFVVIYDSLLVKMGGMIVGVAYEDREAEHGSLLRGKWYYPTEKITRGIIERAYIHGDIDVSLPPSTKWSHIRSVRPVRRSHPYTAAAIVSQAEKAALSLQRGERTTTQEERMLYRSTNRFGYPDGL